MLDIGWSELLVVAIVAIVVVGPKDLPKLMRTVGFYAGKARRAAADFQRQFNEAMAETEAEEVRKNLEAIKSNLGPVPDLNQPIGKPLMTGPSAAPETNFVAPPQAETVEPPLPAPPNSAAKTTAEKRATSTTDEPAAENAATRKTPANKKAPAKKASAKNATAKKAAAKKKAPAKRKPRSAQKAAATTKNGEPKR